MSYYLWSTCDVAEAYCAGHFSTLLLIVSRTLYHFHNFIYEEKKAEEVLLQPQPHNYVLEQSNWAPVVEARTNFCQRSTPANVPRTQLRRHLCSRGGFPDVWPNQAPADSESVDSNDLLLFARASESILLFVNSILLELWPKIVFCQITKLITF